MIMTETMSTGAVGVLAETDLDAATSPWLRGMSGPAVASLRSRGELCPPADAPTTSDNRLRQIRIDGSTAALTVLGRDVVGRGLVLRGGVDKLGIDARFGTDRQFSSTQHDRSQLDTYAQHSGFPDVKPPA
jgi:hypothetical protein